MILRGTYPRKISLDVTPKSENFWIYLKIQPTKNCKPTSILLHYFSNYNASRFDVEQKSSHAKRQKIELPPFASPLNLDVQQFPDIVKKK